MECGWSYAADDGAIFDNFNNFNGKDCKCVPENKYVSRKSKKEEGGSMLQVPVLLMPDLVESDL